MVKQTRHCATITTILLLFAPAVSAVPITPVKAIDNNKTGEFVTVEGTVSNFRLPVIRQSPYSFTLKDADATIRVCIWPEIYDRLKVKSALKTTDTLVKITAEVAEFNNKLELHLQDWDEIQLSSATSITSQTLTSDSQSTGQLPKPALPTPSIPRAHPFREVTK